MSEENNTVESKVETVDVDIDAIFGATTDSVVVPEEKKPNVMSRPSTEVDSVENRAAFFNATKKHHSTSCSNAPFRLNINVNFL